jgi:hypothetical protein
MKKTTFKPVVGISDDEVLHLLFFDQFIKNYQSLVYGRKDFNALVLSGMFLHLTLESYITWINRWLLKNVNRRKNIRLLRLWEKHYENNASLNKRIQFFSNIFLTIDSAPEVKKIEELINRLGALRNSIVHGHEFSVTRWSNGKVEKTKFAELLTFQKIDEHYNDFKNCMNIIETLLKKIDIEDMTAGLPSKKWVTNYLKFNPKNTILNQSKTIIG